MSARILHISDLHTGIREHPDVEAATAALVERMEPELVVASGDLSHRGRRAQLERAHAFLDSLGPPVLAVPGNHDIPHSFPARLSSPWAEFERLWETTEPTYASASLQVIGLNSARPYRHQSGRLRDDQLRGAAERLAEAGEGAYRVVVLHHHLLGAPWRAARKHPVAHRDRVLRELAGAGAELIVSGHIHQSAVSERREFEVVGREALTTVLTVAPGFGQPRPNRLGEARGLHVYEIETETVTVLTHIWQGADWGLEARRTFARGPAPL
ncbi:MAG TPA: metallophosphoesterase [Gaiellaceae bacterium]